MTILPQHFIIIQKVALLDSISYIVLSNHLLVFLYMDAML